MRYSDRITFISETEGGYNPITSEHDEAVREDNTFPCNISNLGIERSVKLFGAVDISVIVARLQRPYTIPFDYVEVNGDRYNVKSHTPHRSKSVFYLEGARL